MDNNATVEDCLEILIGLKGQSKFQLESKDISILQSIGRQVFKGIALTDRQYVLVKEKLEYYKDQFLAQGQDISLALGSMRMPLRSIDRTKYIKIVNDVDGNLPFRTMDSRKGPWIEVRFPFSKKIIVSIDEISRTPDIEHYHSKGSHKHYFKFSERAVFLIIQKFKDKNFEIENEILDFYEKLLDMNNNKENYVPGVYDLKLKNLDDRAINYMISSIGMPSLENLSLYIDRKDKFGIQHFDQADYERSLSALSFLAKRIATRNKFNVFISSKKYNFNQVVESIVELYRFPLLVVIPEQNKLQALSTVNNGFNGVIPPEFSSVMFRLDNDNDGKMFNDYVRDQGINNPVDKNTKIVYIDTNKIPKPLLKVGWKPSAVLLLESSRSHSKIAAYVQENDLIIHYDEEKSRFLSRDLEVIE